MQHPCPEEHPYKLDDLPLDVLNIWIYDNAFCRKDGFRVDDGKALRAARQVVHPD